MTRKNLRLICIALACGSALLSMRQLSLESNVIHTMLGQTHELRAQVVTDPTRMKARTFGSVAAPTSYSFLAQTLEIDKRYRTRIPIRVIGEEDQLLPGQIISITARLIPTKERRVAALAIARELSVATEPSRWARALGAIRSGLQRASGDGNAAALIPGMVLGDTSAQSNQFAQDMRRSGLTHLVAVSGANFAIVSSFVLWAMSFLFSSLRTRLIATAISLSAFIALVRPSPSVLRAAAMAAVLLIAQGSARRKDPLPALGFAIAAVIAIDPWQSRDPGFALSVLATAGLLLLSAKFPGPIAAPVAAMIFCAPVIIAISGYLSPMSIVANVLAAPVVAPITIVGFIAALISPFSHVLASLLLSLISPLAGWICLVALWCARFPVIAIASLAFIAIALLLVLSRSKMVLTFLIAALLLSYLQRFPSGPWDIAQCNVGQGDALVIKTVRNRAVVIDTGPDPALIDRCLSNLGMHEIALVIITHDHADHAGGLSGVMRHRKVDEIWRDVRAGTRAHVDDLTIDVLWPRTAQERFSSLPGDGSELNNRSIAVAIYNSDFSIVAAGDLEPPAQSQIQPPRVDIYKVSHHGSRYQDEGFTRALAPRIALISVGRGNAYGHPADETLALLHRIGAEIFRTDRDGAIALDAKAHRFTVRTSESGFGIWRWR